MFFLQVLCQIYLKDLPSAFIALLPHLLAIHIPENKQSLMQPIQSFLNSRTWTWDDLPFPASSHPSYQLIFHDLPPGSCPDLEAQFLPSTFHTVLRDRIKRFSQYLTDLFISAIAGGCM